MMADTPVETNDAPAFDINLMIADRAVLNDPSSSRAQFADAELRAQRRLPNLEAAYVAVMEENARLVEILSQIECLEENLRQGGPDPMDLEDLSSALSQAVDLAHAARAKEASRTTLGGHQNTEAEAIAMMEHLNCPHCGGSGHVGDVLAEQFSPLGDNHHNAAKCPHCNPEYEAQQAEIDRLRRGWWLDPSRAWALVWSFSGGAGATMLLWWLI